MFVQSNLLRDILPYFRRKLKGIYDESEIDSIFFLTTDYQFGLTKSQTLEGEKRLTESELLWFREVVERLQKSEPIQYILEKADFYGLTLKVNNSVLIPRPETEELVDLIVKEIPALNGVVLDIGTGSGCIPLALKMNFPEATVFGVDISAQSLMVARQNANELQLNVQFLIKDILKDEIPEISTLHVIVSNPPYIPITERENMHANVKEFEPSIALFVEEDDPIIFYRKILQLGIKKLVSGGKVYFEIHPPFAKDIADLAMNIGFVQTEIKKDLSGKERFVIATK